MTHLVDPDAQTAVPLRFAAVWITAADGPECPVDDLNTWLHHHPGADLQVLEEQDLVGMRCETHARAWLAAGDIPAAADMMRYEWLLDSGGIAIDADEICRQRLPDWLLQCNGFACWEHETLRTGLISTAVVGARRDHPVIARALEIALRGKPGVDLAWEATGPGALTRAYDSSRFSVFPSHFFCPRHYAGTQYAESGPVYGDQLWQSTEKWRAEVVRHRPPAAPAGYVPPPEPPAPPARIAVVVLAHHDSERFGRALKSAQAVEGAEAVVAVVDTTAAEGADDLRRTASTCGVPVFDVAGGNAGRAKRRALEHAAESVECDYLLLLDGDDMLYPSAVRSVREDLRSARDPRPALIGYYGFDTLSTTDPIWTTSATVPWTVGEQAEEPGWNLYPYVTPWMPRLWRLPLVRELLPPADMPAYEDGDVVYRALAEHIAGRHAVLLSLSTDIYVVDRDTPSSVQKDMAVMNLCADALRARRTRHVTRERSSPGELEHGAHDPLLDHAAKSALIADWRAVTAAPGPDK